MKKTSTWMERIARGNMILYKDKNYNFIQYFNELNGFLLRSNVLKNGVETDVVPFRRSYPELIDVGIMGTCTACDKGICKAAGIDCYQNASLSKRQNMSLKIYKAIVEQSKGKTFQIALGGAGDPNKHESFREILELTRENLIVPNLTTSGYKLTDDEISLMKKYCGAVAVSFYSRLLPNKQESNEITISAIKRLISAGCTTNIHYVVSKNNLEEIIYRLQNDLFPEGINACVFLLYKPVGQADCTKMPTIDDEAYKKFIDLATNKKYRFKVGFDTCQSPALRMFGKTISEESLDFCESARFSMYIDCENQAYPCSFGWMTNEYRVDLNDNTISEAWNSNQFNDFTKEQHLKCGGDNKTECRCCALDLGIRLCDKVSF